MSAIDETHDRGRASWLESANGHCDFPIQNLPFGIFSGPDGPARPGVAIGDFVLDLSAASREGLLAEFPAGLFSAPTLNGLLAFGERRNLRRRLFTLLSDVGYQPKVEPLLRRINDVALQMPAAIGDYTDFYAGIHHAENVGRLFRPDNPLLPNYKHVPIGYHGRASSVRVSGHAVRRPNGQRKGEGEAPSFGPSTRLDYELELGIWIGAGNELGETIPIAEAPSHIAGFCLLNDWSARDIQAWEYQPLGPFLAKNFATTISPWIVTAEAMAPFRIAQSARPAGDPQPLAYLWDPGDQAAGALAIDFEVSLLTGRMRASHEQAFRLSRSQAHDLYWTPAQLVTHHASNGCNMNPGDLLGTGTISGSQDGQCGSLLEVTQGGRVPVKLPNGETRTFLEDGDEVLFHGRAHADGYASIGFGPCRGVIRPAP